MHNRHYLAEKDEEMKHYPSIQESIWIAKTHLIWTSSLVRPLRIVWKANTWLRRLSRNCWGIMNKIILNLRLYHCPAISWIMEWIPWRQFIVPLPLVLRASSFSVSRSRSKWILFLPEHGLLRLMIRTSLLRTDHPHPRIVSHSSTRRSLRIRLNRPRSSLCNPECGTKVTWMQDDISKSVMEEISSSTSYCSSSSPWLGGKKSSRPRKDTHGHTLNGI